MSNLKEIRITVVLSALVASTAVADVADADMKNLCGPCLSPGLSLLVPQSERRHCLNSGTSFVSVSHKVHHATKYVPRCAW